MGEIIMPKMGDAMTEGKVVRWYKQQGDVLKSGEPVLEIETDKVNLDLEAEEDGVLDEVTVEAGTMVPVGGHLATIRGKGEAAKPAEAKPRAIDPPAEKPAAKDAGEQEGKGKEPKGKEADRTPRGQSNEPAANQAETGEQRPRPRAVPPPPEQAEESGETRVKSSPLARKMARELGVSLGGVRGSGPSGRITAADIRQAAEVAPRQEGKRAAAPREKAKPQFRRPPPLEEREVPLTAMRRTIAKRLGESTGPVPHFFLTIDLDVTNLMSLRQQYNEIEGVKVSVNDFVIRAAALALLHHPMVNASFGAESISMHGKINIGIAVSTPEGLITPVVREADTKGVPEIAEEVRAMAERARNRKLRPEEYQGSTFTISNLGMYGIEEFTAIINPPNAAILAIGAAKARPVVIDGSVVVRERMRVTMSCDHRVVDGALGAQYLQTFQQYIEQPLRLIV